jgi:outer membrane receptor protein involved in Fe transport
LLFGDGVYEPFNAPSGSIMGAYGNIFQVRQNFTWTRTRHTWKAGGEIRVNRDTTVFGVAPNGSYTFGGGAAYAPVAIRSASGAHDIQPGDPLPDALTGLLTATPFSYTINTAPPLFPQGARIGDAAIRRQAYNVFFQDRWVVSPRLTLNYGLRYEVNSVITEGKKQVAGFVTENADGVHVNAMNLGVEPHYLIRPDPYYPTDWGGWGPRLSVDWKWNDRTVFRLGGSITPLLMNLWQQNSVTAN